MQLSETHGARVVKEETLLSQLDLRNISKTIYFAKQNRKQTQSI